MNQADEIELVQNLANMSFADARKCRDNILDSLSIEMPLVFENKETYLAKLEELLDKEAQADSVELEMIGEAGVEFEFVERLAIYCKIKMHVPKTHQQHIRENTLLRITIPIVKDPLNPVNAARRYYIGTGTIK